MKRTAIALVAIALLGSSHAAIAPGTSGNGELFLNVVDSPAKVSYTLDLGITMEVHEPRRGYGQACLAGIAAVPEADVVAFLDGDYSDYPGQLVDVLAPILRGEADLDESGLGHATCKPAHPDLPDPRGPHIPPRYAGPRWGRAIGIGNG